MNTASASTIQNIARLLDNGFIVYVHMQTCKVTAIPEFDDFADFNDSTELAMEEVEMHPERYLNVKGMNSRELYNTMMDFATEQEFIETTKKLVEALRKPDGIKHFNDCIRMMEPKIRLEWLAFRDEKIQHFIKNKLMRRRFLMQ